MSKTRLNQLIRGVLALTHRGMTPREAYEVAEQKLEKRYGDRRYPGGFEAFWKENSHYFPGKEKKPSLIQRLGWGSSNYE